MTQDSLFLQGTLEKTEVLDADSVFTTTVELKNNPVDVRYEAKSWGFILFFVCFFVIISIISKRNKFLLSMFSGLYRNKDRQSMFYETVTNETLNKIVLSFQTIILISIIIFCYSVRENFFLLSSLTQMFLFIGKIILMLIAFFLYKYIAYAISGAIFFNKESIAQWNDDFFSLISLNGLFLFFPTLILFYVEAAYNLCIIFIVLYLFLNIFLIFYKIYVIFFKGKQRLLYFILYLCTQEIIPLYLVYRGFVYLIAQKDTIWMQV